MKIGERRRSCVERRHGQIGQVAAVQGAGGTPWRQAPSTEATGRCSNLIEERKREMSAGCDLRRRRNSPVGGVGVHWRWSGAQAEAAAVGPSAKITEKVQDPS